MVVFNIRKRHSRNIETKKDNVHIIVAIGGVEVFTSQSSLYGFSVQEAIDSAESFVAKMRTALKMSGVNSKVERSEV